LAKLVTAYQQRKFDEDVSYLENELGGIDGLADKLRVNLD
jgi:magnesium-transporting ATPase (P-type)